MTEKELESFLRTQGYDYGTAYKLLREIRRRHLCGISRPHKDPIGKLLRELEIDPARIEMIPQTLLGVDYG